MTKLQDLKTDLIAKGVMPSQDAAGAITVPPHMRPGHRRPEKRTYVEPDVFDRVVTGRVPSASPNQSNPPRTSGIEAALASGKLTVTGRNAHTQPEIQTFNPRHKRRAEPVPHVDFSETERRVLQHMASAIYAYCAKDGAGVLQPRFAGNAEEHVWRGLCKYHRYADSNAARSNGWSVVPVTVVET